MSAAFDEPEIADTEELAVVPLAEKVSREGLWMVQRDVSIEGLEGEDKIKAILARHSLILHARDAEHAESLYRDHTGHYGPLVVEGVQ